MAKRKMNPLLAKIEKRTIDRTNALVIGKEYFLQHGRRDGIPSGLMVRVISKSTEANICGWPSSVEVEVIAPVNFESNSAFTVKYYAVGSLHTVNASNLYDGVAGFEKWRKENM